MKIEREGITQESMIKSSMENIKLQMTNNSLIECEYCSCRFIPEVSEYKIKLIGRPFCDKTVIFTRKCPSCGKKFVKNNKGFVYRSNIKITKKAISIIRKESRLARNTN